MILHGDDMWKDNIWQNFLEKYVFDRHQRSKKVKFPTKLLFFSRKYPVAEKLEQLKQNRKKHLKAHLTGYQRLPIGFEL